MLRSICMAHRSCWYALVGYVRLGRISPLSISTLNSLATGISRGRGKAPHCPTESQYSGQAISRSRIFPTVREAERRAHQANPNWGGLQTHCEESSDTRRPRSGPDAVRESCLFDGFSRRCKSRIHTRASRTLSRFRQRSTSASMKRSDGMETFSFLAASTMPLRRQADQPAASICSGFVPVPMVPGTVSLTSRRPSLLWAEPSRPPEVRVLAVYCTFSVEVMLCSPCEDRPFCSADLWCEAFTGTIRPN